MTTEKIVSPKTQVQSQSKGKTDDSGRAIKSTKKLTMKEKVSYGLGNLAANLLVTTVNSFILFFYTEISLLPVAIVGTLLFISGILDGVSDLIAGILVDKTKSKYGKARPWLLWMAIPLGLGMMAIFHVPNFSPSGRIIYAFISYIIGIVLIYAMLAVPYNSMMALMTQQQNERASLATFRATFGAIGALLVNVVTLPIVNFFGGGARGWQIMAIIYGLIATVIYLTCFKNTKERVIVVSQKEKTPVKANVKAVLKNKYWLLLISIILMTFINFGLGSVTVFYAQFILGDASLIGLIGLAQIPMLIAMITIVSPLLKKFGKRNIFRFGMLLSIAGKLIIALNPTNIIFVMIGHTISSLGIAPGLVACFAMMSDTVEYGEWKTGKRTEGLLFSAGTFGEKVGIAFGGLVATVILSTFGYVSGQVNQTTYALGAIKFLFIFVPIIFNIITIILLSFYKLDNEYSFCKEIIECLTSLLSIEISFHLSLYFHLF